MSLQSITESLPTGSAQKQKSQSSSIATGFPKVPSATSQLEEEIVVYVQFVTLLVTLARDQGKAPWQRSTWFYSGPVRIP